MPTSSSKTFRWLDCSDVLALENEVTMGTTHNLKPGGKVILAEVPTGLLTDLPSEDQKAILEIIGKPILFVGLDDGRAELEFTDDEGVIHFIYVDPKFLRPAQ